MQIHRWDWLDLMNDFDEVAALMTALDLVVAPFNAVSMLERRARRAHGAMGNRYGWAELGTDRMPWMPAIVVASAHADEEWDDVLATAAASRATMPSATTRTPTTKPS